MTPFTQVTLTRIARLVLSMCVSTPALALAQTPPADVPQTRADVIAAERAEMASLWPERQKAMVDLVNGLVERGFRKGSIRDAAPTACSWSLAACGQHRE